MLDINGNEDYRLEGFYEEYPQYGDFSVELCDDGTAIVHYRGAYPHFIKNAVEPITD